MGKTTLLAQAVAENRLAPRGDDVWIGLEQGDADGLVLARDVLAALRAEGGRQPPARSPARRTKYPIRPRWPTPCGGGRPRHSAWWSTTCTCSRPGSAGAIWLTALVNALPANGHVVLASRSSPAVPLARLATQGAVLGLAEDDLRFTDDELAGFAARRGIAIGRLDDTGGWPAMAEVAASVGRDRSGDYLWEDILEPLGPERRRVLAVLSDLGGADEGLAGAALGPPSTWPTCSTACRSSPTAPTAGGCRTRSGGACRRSPWRTTNGCPCVAERSTTWSPTTVTTRP